MTLDRIFTDDDQRAFAQLSGDANPLHVDPILARRTPFGGTVVHGVHAALWILDGWCDAPRILSSLRVVWKHPIRVGERVRVTLSVEGGTLRASAEAGGRQALTLVASGAPSAASST